MRKIVAAARPLPAQSVPERHGIDLQDHQVSDVSKMGMEGFRELAAA